MKTREDFSGEAIFHTQTVKAIKEFDKYECIKIKHSKQ